MKKITLTAVALVCMGLAGCATHYADTPAPTRFANMEQPKLQAARHWQLIADNFAEQMAGALRDQLKGRAVYVPQPEGEQLFVEGFRELLISSLVARGVPVAVNEAGSLVADVRYNAYAFHPGRVASTYFYGEASALTAGLWALGGVMVADLASAGGVSAGLKALAAVSAIEGFGWVSNEALAGGRFAGGPVPRTEILLTVTVVDAGRIVARQSNIYYTADEDAGLYWQRNKRGANSVVKVFGDCAAGEVKCAR